MTEINATKKNDDNLFRWWYLRSQTSPGSVLSGDCWQSPHYNFKSKISRFKTDGSAQKRGASENSINLQTHTPAHSAHTFPWRGAGEREKNKWKSKRTHRNSNACSLRFWLARPPVCLFLRDSEGLMYGDASFIRHLVGTFRGQLLSENNT